MKAHFAPLQFGGWRDHQEWVDHDFMPREGFAAGRDRPGKDGPTAEISEHSSPLFDEPTLTDPAPADVQYEDGLVIRPYVRTGGRAAAAYDLRLETMLITRISWKDVNPHYRPPEFSDIGRICTLCEIPLSVAELSAYLKAPLGVVRVLVCDAITQGFVLMADDDSDTLGRPSMETLRRVHEGLIKML
ncbi:DUF742 domain-containing protein [Actinocrispum sp. NPDC049592]|uniref:DUF742 domain-containing protein n=1 Tax=Actinocrispum sp. NPDC049592 TaxID=3154835 RepID=UPI003416CD46